MIRSFRSLFNRLHSVFNRDPGREEAIVVDGGDSMTVDGYTLTIRDGASTHVMDLSVIGDTPATLQDVVDWINGLGGGLTATLLFPYGNFLAGGILEESEIFLPGNLGYPTATNTVEMGVYGWILDEQATRLLSAQRSLYMDTAVEFWLDTWGRDQYGLPRENGESDADYYSRIVATILKPVCNNMALAQLVYASLGETVRFVDNLDHPDADIASAADAPFRFSLFWDHNASQLQPADYAAMEARIVALVNKYRAAGTLLDRALTTLLQSLTELIQLEEVYALTVGITREESPIPGPIFLGAGWVLGCPGLKFGTNSAIKEQCVVSITGEAQRILG